LELANLPTYILKMQKAIKKETQWAILNSVLVELHPANLGILEMQTDDPIYA